MSKPAERICNTCRLPTQAVLNSIICAGWRTLDGGVTARPHECPTWRVQQEQWSVSEAIAVCAFAGIPMSRPTVIAKLRQTNAGWQLGGTGGRWIIDPEKFKLILKREYQCRQ
jgi:hypothetical protein